MNFKKFVYSEEDSREGWEFCYVPPEWALSPYVIDFNEEEVRNAPSPTLLDRLHPSLVEKGYGVLYDVAICLIEIPEEGLPDWSTSNKKEFRQILRRNKDTVVKYTEIKGNLITKDSFMEMIKFYQMRYPLISDFEIDFFLRKYIPNKDCVVITSYINNEKVAVDFSVIEFGRMYGIFCSWNEKFKYYSLGKFSVLKCVEYAQKKGIKIYDFGFDGKNFQYKRQLSTKFSDECYGIAIVSEEDNKKMQLKNTNIIRRF